MNTFILMDVRSIPICGTLCNCNKSYKMFPQWTRTHPPHNCIGADQFSQYPDHHPTIPAISADQLYVLELVIAPFHALSNHVISYLESDICNQLQICWKTRIIRNDVLEKNQKLKSFVFFLNLHNEPPDPHRKEFEGLSL